MLNLAGMPLTLGQTLWLLSPELNLLLAGVLILVLDHVLAYQHRKRWLPTVALAGLAGAFVATVTLWDCDTRLLSVLSCDNFALAIKAIVLVAMALIVFIADFAVQARAGHRGVFYALLMLSALAICLLGAAVDLTVIVLAFELLNVSSYILVGILRGEPRSSEAAIKYFLYGAVLTGVMLYGLSWFYGVTGSTDLSDIAQALAESEAGLRTVILPALILVIGGIAFKVAAAPFHQWMPDVCEGMSMPAVVLLSVAPVIAGFAGLTRVLLTALPTELKILAVDWRTLLITLAALTMTVGNLVALWQQNVRRLLSYFSIAQAGYILVGVAAASPLGTTAVLFALAAYVLSILGAFTAIVALSKHTGSDAIGSYVGMHERAPELVWPLLLCLLSLAGIPPTAGFVSRLYLFSAAIKAGLLWLAVVGVLNSVVSLACVWKIIRPVFLIRPPVEERVTLSPVLTVALGVAVVGVFATVIFANPLLVLFQAAAQALFG
jgi:NADH-quinone oxidoreductase subunit N